MRNENRIYLTFDIDWACDEVLEYTVGLLKEYGIRGTFNATHKTDYLSTIENCGNELGIHPNFNNILENHTEQQYEKVIEQIKSYVPYAVTVRSHALVTGTPIRRCLAKKGLKYELNTFVSPKRGTQLFPWNHFGLAQIPFVFEDDIYLEEEEKRPPIWFINGEYRMMKVFNFHPIHIYLNTDTLERYKKAKPYTKNIEELVKYRNMQDFGIEKVFRKIIETALEKHYQFDLISNIII